MEEGCPQLLDLIPKDRDQWVMKRDEMRSHGCSSEEKKLELRLGPPGEDYYYSINGSANSTNKNNIIISRNRDESLLSLGYFSSMAAPNMSHTTTTTTTTTTNNNNSAKRGFMEPVERNSNIINNGSQNQKFCSYLHHQFPSNTTTTTTTKTPQGLPVMAKESSQTCCTKVVDLQNAEKKAFSPSSANTAVPNSSQKRTAPAAVVGWPPIRSFRKNLASTSSSKPAPESQNEVSTKVASEKPVESCTKGLFVKINMEGVPIGRKVDLKACDSYENLSSAVDKLFRGLLAAQRDSSVGGIQNKPEENAITGLLDGSGEYTLVYEDNEGDRMLVGDVPWHMFVTTVKRLRVLKSSELSALSLVNKQGKMRT